MISGVHTCPAWLSAVHHDGSPKYVSNLHPGMGETVRIRLRVGAAAPVRRVFVRTCPDGEQAFTPATPGPTHPPAKWWRADLPVREPVLHYRFVLEADDGVWFYSAAGPAAHDPLDATDFRLLADAAPPGWVRSAVFYQIFPDRFANGDPSRDPRPEEYEYRGHRPRTYPWETLPTEEHIFPLVFYGGDLRGMRERLDYLQRLGVSALYLNPVFTSFSNHKYDVADYEHVDPHLGGDEELARLRRDLTERGMRYLLDLVPNHTGALHPWFEAAQADASAPEAGFFTFAQHPHEYATWLGVSSLPKLNYRSEELRRRMVTGPDSVLRRWLRPPFSADGWRVDVANMLARQGEVQLGLEIARAIRAAVRETRPDAYLLGEHFFDATAQLQGDQWDGVMNYAGFTFPLWHWLRGYEQRAHGMKDAIASPVPWPTAALESAWRSRIAALPWAIALQQYNQLGSHDVPRIRTIVGGSDALHRLAAVVQFTYPGVPGVYYGDEIGMKDVPRLGPRGCMIWDETRWDAALLAFYRELIALRRTSPLLQEGGFQMLVVEPDTFAYQREGRQERLLVVAHRAERPRPAGPIAVAHGGIPDGMQFVERFSGKVAVTRNGMLPLPEISRGPMIWVAEDPASFAP
jgi:alpha-glucosidase